MSRRSFLHILPLRRAPLGHGRCYLLAVSVTLSKRRAGTTACEAITTQEVCALLHFAARKLDAVAKARSSYFQTQLHDAAITSTSCMLVAKADETLSTDNIALALKNPVKCR